MKTLKDFDFKNKKVLVRCDFQVPIDGQGRILDDFKIISTVPTIEYLIKKEAKVILMSHWKPAEQEKAYSLKPIASILKKLLKREVKFLADCIGTEIKEEIERMKPTEVVLLENLRFYKEEEENDENFAKELAQLGEIYINDAFSVCHRAHASIVGIPKFLPSGIGLLLEKEIKNLKKILENPARPMVAIIGGKKVETKVKPINKILEIADLLIISGLIKKEIDEKKVVLNYPQKVIYPVDASEEDGKDLDIGPKTIKIFKEKILKAKTIFWNGPFGMIEKEKFIKGTLEIAKAIVESGAFSVVGGGETIEFLNKIGLTSKFNQVSTGGGAMLEFISGEELPGLKVLE